MIFIQSDYSFLFYRLQSKIFGFYLHDVCSRTLLKYLAQNRLTDYEVCESYLEN